MAITCWKHFSLWSCYHDHFLLVFWAMSAMSKPRLGCFSPYYIVRPSNWIIIGWRFLRMMDPQVTMGSILSHGHPWFGWFEGTTMTKRKPPNIWRFPKIGVPPNHPIWWDFHLLTIHFAYPPSMEIPICLDIAVDPSTLSEWATSGPGAQRSPWNAPSEGLKETAPGIQER